MNENSLLVLKEVGPHKLEVLNREQVVNALLHPYSGHLVCPSASILHPQSFCLDATIEMATTMNPSLLKQERIEVQQSLQRHQNQIT